MDIGLLLLRLTVGLTLAAHGTQKLFGWFGGPGLDATGQFFEMIGFTPSRRHALMAGLAETGGGLLLAVGLLPPVASALVFNVMLWLPLPCTSRRASSPRTAGTSTPSCSVSPLWLSRSPGQARCHWTRCSDFT